MWQVTLIAEYLVYKNKNKKTKVGLSELGTVKVCNEQYLVAGGTVFLPFCPLSLTRGEDSNLSAFDFDPKSQSALHGVSAYPEMILIKESSPSFRVILTKRYCFS
jgi:hypothetical protein